MYLSMTISIFIYKIHGHMVQHKEIDTFIHEGRHYSVSCGHDVNHSSFTITAFQFRSSNHETIPIHVVL